MLDHYKKTFVRTQIVMWMVTAAMIRMTHDVFMAATFFATMQLGALVGSVWGERIKNLKRLTQRRQ